MKITLDFETQSRANLKAVGAYEYSMHPSTIATCMAFSIKGPSGPHLFKYEQMQVPWKNHTKKFQNWWLDAIKNKDLLFEAHNAFFEQCIYNNVLVRRFGWPKIPAHKWCCSAARAAAVAIPRNLAGAGAVMGLAVQKDYEGHRVMMKLCKPTAAHTKWKKEFEKFKSRGRHYDKPEPLEMHTPLTAPEDYEKLYEYCKTDVVTEEHLSAVLPELTPFERRLWLIDQKVNMRGVNVDMPLVNKIAQIMAEDSKTLNNELDVLTMGLVSSGNARNAILDFLTIEGIELPDLKAKTVDDFLENGKVSGDAKKLLEIRRALSKASVAKYKKFQERAASDGRVRDILLYHSASTGRWGGVGIQPQNFPRGIIKDTDTAIEHIKALDVATLKLIYGENLMPLFSSVLRGMFIASPGYELFVEDWSAIETRVLWWLAEHEDGLRAFREGRDPYKEMAAKIFNIPVSEVTEAQRQVGKAAVLGCFEENTKVFTKSGLKRICDISPKDELWDGVEWVQSGGAIYQGKKNVMFWQGIGVTPDHQFLTPGGWVSAQAAAQESTEFHKSMTELVNLPLSATTSALAAELKLFGLVVSAVMKTIRFTFQILERSAQLDAMLVRKLSLLKPVKNISGMQTLSRMTTTVKDYSIEFLRFLVAAKIKTIPTSPTMAAGGLKFSLAGEKSEASFYDILLPFPGGVSPLWNLTASTLTRATSRVICALLLVQKTGVMSAAFRLFKKKLKNETRLLPTYDVAYCGPRNRYTILTNAGPMIVHNCGYQMGGKKFVSSAWDVYRAQVDLALAKISVTAYRELHWPVTELWENYNNAAMNAVKNKGQIYTVGRVQFLFQKKFLWVKLPSGRKLAYKDPSIEWKTIWLDPEGSVVNEKDITPKQKLTYNNFKAEGLRYWAINQKAKKEDCVIPKWTKEATYGGKLTENIVQAVSRDLLAEAIVRADEAGFHVLMHSHDELVCEAPIKKYSQDAYKKVMLTLPKWADGLPLKAGGWVGPRYKKG